MITQVIHNNFSYNEVYCRKLHDIKPISSLPCNTCPYFLSYLQGNGVQCYWEDYTPVENSERNIPYENRYIEMIRTSKMFDLNLIKK